MTCPHRELGAYSPVCTYNGECKFQSAGAYMHTCENINANQPVFTTEHCPYCGCHAPELCCINPACAAYIPEQK